MSDYVDFDPWLTSPGIAEYTCSTPVEMKLQINPNPFSKLTTVNFSIGQSAERMAMQIYDAAGRLVRSFLLPSSNLSGSTSVVWDGTDQSNRKLGNGVYFVTLQAGEYSETRKVLFVR